MRRPFKALVDVLPDNADAIVYVDAFKECYPYLWKELWALYYVYKRMDKGRKKKGFIFRYRFPRPEDYIKKNARAYITRLPLRTNLLSEEIRLTQYEALRLKGKAKLEQQNAKQVYKLRTVQKVSPSFWIRMEQLYFHQKHVHPENVDERLAIVLEAGKYNTPLIENFLYKVNASERNYTVRFAAMQMLQKIGKPVQLQKNRKGKMHPRDAERPELIMTPADLLARMASSPLERMKETDLFLSHSYRNAHEMLSLMVELNILGLSVYLDWANDRRELQRVLFGRETIEVLKRRIDSSKAVLFVLTPESCGDGVYREECLYAARTGKEVLVLELEAVQEMPDFLLGYKRVERQNHQFFVDEKETVTLRTYISSIKLESSEKV